MVGGQGFSATYNEETGKVTGKTSSDRAAAGEKADSFWEGQGLGEEESVQTPSFLCLKSKELFIWKDTHVLARGINLFFTFSKMKVLYAFDPCRLQT